MKYKKIRELTEQYGVKLTDKEYTPFISEYNEEIHIALSPLLRENACIGCGAGDQLMRFLMKPEEIKKQDDLFYLDRALIKISENPSRLLKSPLTQILENPTRIIQYIEENPTPLETYSKNIHIYDVCLAGRYEKLKQLLVEAENNRRTFRPDHFKNDDENAAHFLLYIRDVLKPKTLIYHPESLEWQVDVPLKTK